MSPQLPPDGAITPQAALLNARFIWGGLVASVIGATAVLTILSLQSPSEPTGLDRVLSVAAAVMVPVAGLVGYVLRQQAHKANWKNNAVTPRGYVTGLILQLAPLDGAAIVAGVFMILGAPIAFILPIIGVALALMAINFPNGRAMLPPDARGRIGNFDA